MRAFVFLLILVNLLFFSWAQGYFGLDRDADAFRVEQQLLADRIKLVSRDEPPAEKPERAEKAEPLAAVKPPERKVDEVCLRLVDLPIADAVRLESRVAERLPAAKALRTINPVSGTYWVFIPPLASRQDLDRKVAELKRFGVDDFFVVQEAGPEHWAISLGVFSTRAAAEERLEELRGKSVRTAKVGERNVKAASATLELRGPRSDGLAALVAEMLPDARPLACPVQQ